MHGGEIKLDSDQGKGSTFSFTLPVKPAQTQAAASAPADAPVSIPPLSASTPAAKSEAAPAQTLILPPDNAAYADPQAAAARATAPAPRLVLVIDKDPQLTDIYRRYLIGQEFTVVALTELDQVMSVARSIQPFAITLDVTMQSRPGGPGAAGDDESASPSAGESVLDGWQVLEMLKSDPDTQSIPLIVCTMISEQERAKRLGAADYLLKPILQEELIHTLERLRQ
jgi:CheY-like chemotaxis protein